MNRFKNNIPNLITCLNLVCGFFAIIKIAELKYVEAANYIYLGAFFDFVDGMAARYLKTNSILGKDLDSLADMVTFGAAPTYMMYMLILTSLINFPNYSDYIATTAILILVCSAWRLARFNHDVRQKDGFIGLPTPANAILISSMPIVHLQFYDMMDKFNHPFVLAGISIVLSYLLVSPIHLFSLKFKQFGWQGNQIRYSFLVVCAALIIPFKMLSIPIIIILYFILSLVFRKRLDAEMIKSQ